MYFIQLINLCNTDYIWIVRVREFDKLSYLSVLISIDILHYIILYFIVLMWMWYDLSRPAI